MPPGITQGCNHRYWISRATFSKNNFSITVGTGISATSTTHISSPQHPMQKIGNQRHVPSLLNPHSPLQLDLLKYKSLPWLSFFLMKAPSPKLIHNAFQSVGVSVFAAWLYVIMFIGFLPELCWQKMLPLNCVLHFIFTMLPLSRAWTHNVPTELCWHTMLPLNYVWIIC